MDGREAQVLVARILFWFAWLGAGAWSGLSVFFLWAGGLHWFAGQFDFFAAVVLAGPFSVAMGLRFLVIPRQRNLWVVFSLGIAGLALAYFMILFGIFLVDRFLGLQCLLYAVTMLVYLPALLPLKSARPGK